MSGSEKMKCLVEAYIELGQESGYEDAQIFDALTDIFDEEELEDMGFSFESIKESKNS